VPTFQFYKAGKRVAAMTGADVAKLATEVAQLAKK
jgi:hypothetical protein